MQDKLYKTTLALAGIIQSVTLVRELAQTGKLNEAAFQASIHSIFQTEPQDVSMVYGNISDVKVGLEKLVQMFSLGIKASRPLMRIAFSLLHIQKKVARSRKISNELTERLQKIKKQVDYFHLVHPTVINNLADAYLTAISTFHFRIIIWGHQRSLSVTENMDKIRALLLAGVRSAFLWRQMGGSRFQILFARAKIKAMAEKILAEIALNEVK